MYDETEDDFIGPSFDLKVLKVSPTCFEMNET